MKTKLFLVSFVLSFAAATVCLASDEQTLRDLDAHWASAAEAKNLDQTVSYYADDATVLPPNEHAVTTKEDLRKIELWTARHGVALADWPTAPVDPFFNVNTPEDLAKAEALARENAGA